MRAAAGNERISDGAEESAPLLWTPPAEALPPGATFVMTTRVGGVSEGPFASLNLGLGVPDREDAVRENVRRLRARLAIPEGAPARLRQIHGDIILTHERAGAAADGFLVEAGDPWVSVTVADCAAVAIVAADAAWGALLHSGWKGTALGIAPRAVQLLALRGVRPESLHVVIAPCIHACCYPVGAGVARRFPVTVLIPRPEGGFALDLPGAIAASLVDAGVPRERIAAAAECTASLPSRFYSHRRDRGATGRHWALLKLEPRAR